MLGKKLSVMSLALGIFLISSTSNVYAKTKIQRLQGEDRYKTSSAIVNHGFQKSDYAIVASGEGFADALSAVPLAKKHNAPIILTEGKDLNVNAKAELKRLKVKNVIIIGGNGSISKNTESHIKGLNISVERIYGQTRYDTSLAIAKKIGTKNGVVVTNGEGFADSLSMATIAAKDQMPIILTPANELPSKTKEFLSKSSYDKSYVLGGSTIVSEKTKNFLKNSKRIYGQNRYKTNIAILNEFKDELQFGNVYIAGGENFPDALSVSALASKTSSPVMIVSKHLDISTSLFFEENYKDFKNVFPVGGKAVVSDSIVDDISDGRVNITSCFKDKNFEKAVRNTISKPTGSIYKSDVENVNEFKIPYDNINNINGLQYFKNVQKIFIQTKDLAIDMSPVKDLTQLEELSIYGSSNIKNIDSIKNLINLKKIHLGQVKISNLDILKKLTKLQVINIVARDINNIDGIKDLNNLQEIYLPGNEITNIDDIKNLKELRKLNLDSNKISDITPLKNLTKLENLGLMNNQQLEDISVLSNLNNLKDLNLSSNCISDIKPLSNLVNLQCLFIFSNRIKNISSLSKLTNLNRLSLSNNQIVNIESLKNLKKLERVFLDQNNISDISPLSNLTNLKNLELKRNPIKDYSPLKDIIKNIDETNRDFDI